MIVHDPLCSDCGHPASQHVAGDEERRECELWRDGWLCACARFAAPPTDPPAAAASPVPETATLLPGVEAAAALLEACGI